jgi:hypothetical protein
MPFTEDLKYSYKKNINYKNLGFLYLVIFLGGVIL